ncbi:hypothetical protein [Halobacillus sp. A5]|uniref:hypothetical protein n=1 Tax=Halobacillus sp. A5 TaxID=2880263 RepID=UPI0020A62CB8|nr:hypothetical protein [Halobacillus sp. A5]MCP3029481.1 hypothetical protein [Halobacillus sp. A5]
MRNRLIWASAATILYPIVWILLSLLLKGEPPNWIALAGSATGGFLSGLLIAPSQNRRSKDL